MAYTDIFKDESTFPDTLEVTLPNGNKATLGEIRELTRSQQRELAGQMELLTKERKEAQKIATDAADLMNKIQSQPQLEPAKQTTPDDFATDPWWEPARKAINPILDTLKEIQASQKAQQEAVARAASIWAQDRWKGQYERGKERLKGPKYADQTFEKVRDFAAQNKILDEYGFPDIGKAIESITREDEIERIKREAYENGLKEGAVKGRLGATPRPSSAAGAPKPDGVGLKPDGNFNDLGDAVMSDRDLAEAFSQLAGLSPEELLQ